MGTAVGVFIMVVVGLSVVRTVVQMITGHVAPPSGGCGCPACSTGHSESCTVHEHAHESDRKSAAAEGHRGGAGENDSKA